MMRRDMTLKQFMVVRHEVASKLSPGEDGFFEPDTLAAAERLIASGIIDIDSIIGAPQ